MMAYIFFFHFLVSGSKAELNLWTMDSFILKENL